MRINIKVFNINYKKYKFFIKQYFIIVHTSFFKYLMEEKAKLISCLDGNGHKR